MDYADELKKEEKKIFIQITSKNKESLNLLMKSLEEIWKYIDKHKGDDLPISYSMINELFGGLNKSSLSRILKNALRG